MEVVGADDEGDDYDGTAPEATSRACGGWPLRCPFTKESLQCPGLPRGLLAMKALNLSVHHSEAPHTLTLSHTTRHYAARVCVIVLGSGY